MKPCHFCGHENVRVHQKTIGTFRYDKKVRHQVVCQRCFARGPLSETKLEATKRWNDVK